MKHLFSSGHFAQGLTYIKNNGYTLAHDISEASTSLLLQTRTLCLREVHNCIYDPTTSEQACCWLWTRDFHLSLNRPHRHSGCCPFRGPQALVSQLASSLATVNTQNCGSPREEVLGELCTMVQSQPSSGKPEP